MIAPELITFDVFGTVLDWRSGLEQATREAGFVLDVDAQFDLVIDAQSQVEQGPGFVDYATVLARSLTSVLAVPEAAARSIAATAGDWPIFPEAAESLRALMERVPCVAMTNSDRAHGKRIQQRMGLELSDWVCAEETRVYKPDAAFWTFVSSRLQVELGPHWWHVSAYADYDLGVAKDLGLTTVFIPRPHSRRGPADFVAFDLEALAGTIDDLFS